MFLAVESLIADPSDSPQVAELKRRLYWAERKIQVLEERLRLQRIQKYGPASEKLSDAQLELWEGEPGVSHLEVQAERRSANIRDGSHCLPICPGWSG